MRLQDYIARALALTGELHESLQEDRLDAWTGILARRADAMTDFREAHLGADEATRTACGPALSELATADRSLQQLAQEALGAADAEFHERLGAAPIGSSAYDDGALQGAVNRRA